jgi:hypothetical protein
MIFYFGYRLLIPAATTKNILEPARHQPKISSPARPSSSTRSKISLSTPPALPLSVALGQGWRRGTTSGIDQSRGSCYTPLFFPIGSSAPPFFSNIGNGRGRRGGARASRPRHSPLLPHRQWHPEVRPRGAPLFFPNGIGNGAPPFLPNRALLPPLYCTASPPPPSSRFRPIAASSGATWTRCSLARTWRCSSPWARWARRSLSAPVASSTASPSPM